MSEVVKRSDKVAFYGVANGETVAYHRYFHQQKPEGVFQAVCGRGV